MAIVPDNVQSINVSREELQAGNYATGTLVKVLNAMHQDGLVVLKNVIPIDLIDQLNEKMCSDVESLVADPKQGYNHGIKSNILQRPPIMDPQYLHPEIYFNPFLLQLANAYLGPRPTWNWLTANTALADTGGIRQPPHKDSGFNHPQFPYYFIANIPLCDFSVEKGATEFWLGSHAQSSWDDQKQALADDDIKPYPTSRIGEHIPPIADWAMDSRRKTRPPIQPLCSKGDIMIRDLRLWHAGMPNSSNEHRIMLGLGYASSHAPNYEMMLHLPFAQRRFFLNHPDNVLVQAKWYEDEELAKTDADTYFYARPDYLE